MNSEQAKWLRSTDATASCLREARARLQELKEDESGEWAEDYQIMITDIDKIITRFDTLLEDKKVTIF